MGKEHEYCCCAIPLLNVGIYLIILEHLVVGILAGTLAIATPDIVGASVPSFAPWLLTIGCYVVVAIQILGFFGVFKEKASLFQKYSLLNSFAVTFVFGVAATWTIISATNHDTASNKCVSTFYNKSSTSSVPGGSALSGQGKTICDVFAWVDVGLMGGLWVVMAIFQARKGYLLLVIRWYGATQRADHKAYYSIYSVNNAPENDGIDLGERRQDDVWDPRPSTESWSAGGAGGSRPPFGSHARQESDATEKDYGVGAEKYGGPQYGYTDSAVPAAYSDNGPVSRQNTGVYPNQPSQAYTYDSTPTPVAYNSPHHDEGANTYGVQNPTGAMYPNEGQFGRKTPRLADPHNTGYPQSTAPTYHTEPPQYDGRPY